MMTALSFLLLLTVPAQTSVCCGAHTVALLAWMSAGCNCCLCLDGMCVTSCYIAISSCADDPALTPVSTPAPLEAARIKTFLMIRCCFVAGVRLAYLYTIYYAGRVQESRH